MDCYIFFDKVLVLPYNYKDIKDRPEIKDITEIINTFSDDFKKKYGINSNKIQLLKKNEPVPLSPANTYKFGRPLYISQDTITEALSNSSKDNKDSTSKADVSNISLFLPSATILPPAMT